MTSDDSAIASAAIEEQIARKEDHDHTIDWEKAQKGARLLLESIGEDPKRKDLLDTWQRRVPDALATLSEGRRQTAKPIMRTFEANADELVVKTGIPVYSLCELHLLPYHGVAHVAYLAQGGGRWTLKTHSVRPLAVAPINDAGGTDERPR